jgi:hypothetical protein
MTFPRPLRACRLPFFVRLLGVTLGLWVVPGALGAVVAGAGSAAGGSQSPAAGALPSAEAAVVEAAARAPSGDVVLRGRVRAEGVRPDSALPGALVEVRQAGRTRTAVSDERGRYRLEGLDAGPAKVQVFHLATHNLEVEVRLPGSGELTLDLELERRTLSLSGIEVTASRIRGETDRVRPVGIAVDLVGGGPRSLDASTGMVEAGLARALSPLVGEEEPAPDRVLFMRGSTVDARTVLLDGAPVLTPFHVAGIVPPFESELVGGASFHIGAAPSRYGGGLSYLLDVETREPRTEGVGGHVALDGILWRGSLESGLPGGGGLLLAGRSMHGFQGSLGSGEEFPYLYDDLLVRGTVPLGRGDHHVRFTGYRNREGVRLDEVLLAGGQASWGNHAGSLRYDGRIGNVEVSAVAAESRYDSSLPLAWSGPVLARASSLNERGSLEVVMPRDGWSLRLGTSGDRVAYAYQLTSRERNPAGAAAWQPVQLRMTSGGGYAEVAGHLGPRIHARGGVRMDHFSGGGGTHAAPRATIRGLLTDDASLTVSAGRYHQPIPMPGLMAQEVDGEEAALLWDPSLPVASSTHLVLALEQELDEHLNLDVSGFVKVFEGLDGTDRGRVRSSGTDLRVAYGAERVGAWVGYALSWFWEEASGGSSSTFSGRHLVSAGVRGTPYPGVELGAALGYGAGLPFASVPVGGPVEERLVNSPDSEQGSGVWTLSTGNAGGAPLDVMPEDDFLRLDLDLRWTVEPTFAGRKTRLRPYLRVMNALDSRDALFQYLDRWREGEIRPVAERPFLPLIGVEWRF